MTDVRFAAAPAGVELAVTPTAAVTASSALTTKAMSGRGRGVRARSIGSFIDSEIQSTRIRDLLEQPSTNRRLGPGREAAT